MALSAPTRLEAHHDLDGFDCGVPALDDWLKRRARNNAAQGASHTYIVTDAPAASSPSHARPVVAYYALAAGAVDIAAAPGKFRRNMPDPIPVVVLGRFAIDKRLHGRGLGRALFSDAGLRVLQAADIIGVRGLLVDAISDDAKAFYLAIGMVVSPLSDMTLMVTLPDLRASLGAMRP